MTKIKSGRKHKEKKPIAPAAICAAVCAAVCAVSLIIFSAGSKALPANTQDSALPAFYSAAPDGNSFWESFSQFTARLFFQ